MKLLNTLWALFIGILWAVVIIFAGIVEVIKKSLSLSQYKDNNKSDDEDLQD